MNNETPAFGFVKTNNESSYSGPLSDGCPDPPPEDDTSPEKVEGDGGSPKEGEDSGEGGMCGDPSDGEPEVEDSEESEEGEEGEEGDGKPKEALAGGDPPPEDDRISAKFLGEGQLDPMKLLLNRPRPAIPTPTDGKMAEGSPLQTLLSQLEQNFGFKPEGLPKPVPFAGEVSVQEEDLTAPTEPEPATPPKPLKGRKPYRRNKKRLAYDNPEAVHIAARVSAEERDAVQKFAKSKGMTVSDIIRQAVGLPPTGNPPPVRGGN